MTLPDLHDLEIAGVHALRGDPQALAAAAAAAKLRFYSSDLAGAREIIRRDLHRAQWAAQSALTRQGVPSRLPARECAGRAVAAR